MKKTLLLTGYDDAMAYIGHLTSPLMLAYACRYGMDFKCIRNYKKEVHPSWQKAEHILEALADDYKLVLWLDADTVVTNFAIAPWKKISSGIHTSLDWGSNAEGTEHFSLGNFVACNDTIPIWEELLKRATQWGNRPLWEQSCLQELYVELAWVREKISVYPRRCFNPVPPAASTSKVTASEPWRKGDWLCHLTNMHRNDRIAAFYDLLPSEYIIGLSKGDYQTHAAKASPGTPSPLTNCLSD